MKATKILLVDDEQDTLDFLSHNLKKADYKVYTSPDGIDAIEVAKKVLPDLIILDVMMPKMDGIETCKELRAMPETKHTLIVLFTARGEDYSQVAGFEAGADDFISKPISPKVLLSRISAILKRREYSKVTPPARQVVDLGGGIKLSSEGNSIIIGEKELELPKKEFELISLLASKPGKVFSRQDILDRIWGRDIEVNDRTIDVHIRKLRQKLGDHKITTLKGVGYKFEF